MEAITPDLRYRIFLSWEPESIQSNQDVTFYLKIEEMFAKRSEKEIEYEVTLSQEGKTIFDDKILGLANSDKPDNLKFQFSPNNIGTIKLDVFDIEGNSLSKANFLIVIKPQQSQDFPIMLESMPEKESGEGKYIVDLTWFPNTLGLGESEFVITFYDKNTDLPVREA